MSRRLVVTRASTITLPTLTLLLSCKFDATTNVDNMFVAKVGNDGDMCDLCVRNNINCIQNDCYINDGACDPPSGSCMSNPKPNGSPCNDGDSSTTSDSCTNGACAGVNLCAGVSCPAHTNCHNDGACDPASGSCILNPKSNGSPCDDGDSSTTTDSCTNGACAGVNLCAGVSCPAHTNCHNDGVCDPASGSCILNPKSNGFSL